MEKPVLVTWATRSGSTAEVAQTVAQTLRSAGLGVECRPIRDVHTLENCGPIVLGIPLYIGRLHRDGRRFLRTFRQPLAERPVALFVLGPVHDKEEEFATARRQLNAQLAHYPSFAPITHEIFAGRWDPEKLGPLFRMLPVVRRIPAHDARNWVAIHAWAESLCERFRLVGVD